MNLKPIYVAKLFKKYNENLNKMELKEFIDRGHYLLNFKILDESGKIICNKEDKPIILTSGISSEFLDEFYLEEVGEWYPETLDTIVVTLSNLKTYEWYKDEASVPDEEDRVYYTEDEWNREIYVGSLFEN